MLECLYIINKQWYHCREWQIEVYYWINIYHGFFGRPLFTFSLLYVLIWPYKVRFDRKIGVINEWYQFWETQFSEIHSHFSRCSTARSLVQGFSKYQMMPQKHLRHIFCNAIYIPTWSPLFESGAVRFSDPNCIPFNKYPLK